MIGWVIKKILGTQNQREVKRLLPLVEEAKRQGEALGNLSIEQLRAKTPLFRDRLAKGETLDQLLPEAFATVVALCRRLTEEKRKIRVRGQEMKWEMVPFDVQLIGGIVLHSGRIAEMATGEGKTLVATLPTYLNALAGKGVHVVTVNDYLAARDAEWMGEVYRELGLTVGCLQHGQTQSERRAQYACDITYGTCSEFGFDYLRDNGMATTPEDQVQRGHFFAIIDEVDSILIDEARTPLIISGPVTISTHQFDKYKSVIDGLVRKQNGLCTDWANQAKAKGEAGDLPGAGRLLYRVKLGSPRNKLLLKFQEDPAMRRAIDDAELEMYQDTRRTELYKTKEEMYFSIDERNSEADLSEMGRTFLNPNDPNFFLVPDLITKNHDIETNRALSEEEKLKEKQVAQADYEDASQRIHNISQLLRAYCVFEKDVHYVVQENKVMIVDEYTGRLMPGRRWSDGLHQAVEAKEGVQIDRETQTLATITIQNYFRLYEKLGGMTGTAETEANEFKDIYRLGVVVIPTNQPCVRVDADDMIFKTRREKLNALIEEIKKRNAVGQPMLVGTASVESSEIISRMLRRENIPHSVLNAKQHQQEAEIVTRAGERGAVTIATNMAGRGTDIKLSAGVAELGGLHVVGTERHESRRIDRQLRGRCARQGDPGSGQFFISFEDDLMRNFGDSRRIGGLMTKLGMEEDEGLQHPWLNRSVETAQKRVEGRNYQIRKHTLQYDDVMNQQRTVIYAWRTDILNSTDPRPEVFETVDERIAAEVEARAGTDPVDLDGLVRWANAAMPVGLSKEDLLGAGGKEEWTKYLKARVREAYEVKVKFENPEAVKALERFVVLGAIDRLWQEHLYAMDGLRTSINLRAYGQKDPLIEYKNEAYGMFGELMGRIKEEVVHNLFRSASSLSAFEHFLAALPQRTGRGDLPGQDQPTEGSMSIGGGGGGSTVVEEALVPVKRQGPKLGRNDPCPIDRKKKFKNCCGATGAKGCLKVSA